MASQIPLDTKYYPADFHVHTQNLGTLAGPNTLLYYFDRDVVIDSVTLTIPDNPTNANPGVNFKAIKMSTGAVPNYGTPVTGQTDVTTALNVLTGGTFPLRKTWADLTSTGFAATSSTDARGNVVAAGSFLWICSDATVTGVTGPASITVRWRSQL